MDDLELVVEGLDGDVVELDVAEPAVGPVGLVELAGQIEHLTLHAPAALGEILVPRGDGLTGEAQLEEHSGLAGQIALIGLDRVVGDDTGSDAGGKNNGSG